jgi:succinoglycan biosynthesis protein ExoA
MKPPVTVIIPTLNEEGFIGACLEGILRQNYPSISEIFVVDGGSVDRTVDVASKYSSSIRVLNNPHKTAAAAMNIGIAHSTSEIFVRIDAHTEYAPDYVEKCVACLLLHKASVAGGPMRPRGLTPFGASVAAVTTSPFGIGNGRFHYSDKEEEVDTVYLGAFVKSHVLAVGGYDSENLHHSLGEDAELNYRLRKAGHRIFLCPEIESVYFPRSTPRAFARQYLNYGICKASILRKHRRLPTLRPLFPTGLFVGTLALGVAMIVRGVSVVYLAPICGYQVVALAVSTRLRRIHPTTKIWRNLVALEICHYAYGCGFSYGVARILLGRRFDSRG